MKRSLLFLVFLLLLVPFLQAREASEVWDLETLKKAPEAQWSENLPSDESVVVQKVWYAGEPYQGHPTRVFAFVAHPKGDGPFPGIVLVHGGGGTAFRSWVESWAKRGYAAIAMDLAGMEVLDDGARKPLEDGGPDQSDDTKFRFFEEKDYREMWTYHAIADIVRAHSLLDSLPYVDPNRTAATGISWGGYLTSMLGGIDDRFQVIVPVYGCGNLEKNSVWTPRMGAIPWPGVQHWNDFFDPLRYCWNAKCRVFFVAGTDDFAYPLDIHWDTYSRVKNADVRLQVHMPHGHAPAGDPPEVLAYINSVLCGGPELPCLGQLKWERAADGTIQVSAPIKTNAGAAKTAKLHYSTDLGGYVDGKWSVREWLELPAAVDPEKKLVTAVIPQEIASKNPLRIYLDVQTAEGLMVSSHYEVCKPVQKPNFAKMPENGVLLFGRDADGNLVNRFRDMSGAPANWPVENDELISTAKNGINHVHSDVDFRDAQIHVEFQTPRGRDGNSGLYIHGLYEMQVINSQGAHDVNCHDAGAFYLFNAPQTLAGLGGGEWQSYDVTYHAPRRDESGKIVQKGRMTAYLNGILVQDEFEFDEPRSQWTPLRRQTTDCVKQMRERQQKTGFAPLFLQDHGNPTRFRNIWIVPLDE
ncbi:MAG: DUF1080 domain-containing protein [Thermoguttaceae bacterium]|nr:DUF1080 domain-containing protein [Thermoguttaceae bacterium]